MEVHHQEEEEVVEVFLVLQAMAVVEVFLVLQAMAVVEVFLVLQAMAVVEVFLVLQAMVVEEVSYHQLLQVTMVVVEALGCHLKILVKLLLQ